MIGSDASAERPKRTEDAKVKARATRIVPLGLASPRATPKSVFALLPSPSMPPSSSTQVDAQDHADACDDGGRSSPSNPKSQPLSSSAPSSRQPPSAGDRDHPG